jgi:hypothetical protein
MLPDMGTSTNRSQERRIGAASKSMTRDSRGRASEFAGDVFPAPSAWLVSAGLAVSAETAA